MAMTEKDLHEYRKSLTDKSKEELEKIEKELVDEATKIDKEVAETEYDLPTENYKTVAEAVRYFLDKQSVQWQYSLAMVSMYDFWGDKPAKKIPYAQLDTILRTLGGMQFTGYKEWAMVVAVNKFFESLRDAYMETTSKVYDVATKHNVVMELLGLNTPVSGVEA